MMSEDVQAVQPVSGMGFKQLEIEWVPHDSIEPNQYNPNKMSWHDRQLLRQSLLEDGWTQPIVVNATDRQIVDGEQRWTTAGIETTSAMLDETITRIKEKVKLGIQASPTIMQRLFISRDKLLQVEQVYFARMKEAKVGKDKDARQAFFLSQPIAERPCIAAITGGYVPITEVVFDEAHRRLSTIRHNRARGAHQIDIMADIVADLKTMGLDVEDFENRLGMTHDEIHRLTEMASSAENLLAAVNGHQFTEAWKPVDLASVHPVEGSPVTKAARAAAKEVEQKIAERTAEIQSQVKEKVRELAETTGRAVDADTRQRIEKETAAAIPQLRLENPKLKKIVAFFSEEEYQNTIHPVLGETNVADVLLKLCRAALDQQLVLESD